MKNCLLNDLLYANSLYWLCVLNLRNVGAKILLYIPFNGAAVCSAAIYQLLDSFKKQGSIQDMLWGKVFVSPLLRLQVCGINYTLYVLRYFHSAYYSFSRTHSKGYSFSLANCFT